MDFSRVLYGPVYRTLGVAAVLNVGGRDYPITAIDKTAGISLKEGRVDIETEIPAAVVRAADLAALGIAADQLDRASLLLNQASWRVVSHRPLPSPAGEADGELYLMLEAS